MEQFEGFGLIERLAACNPFALLCNDPATVLNVLFGRLYLVVQGAHDRYTCELIANAYALLAGLRYLAFNVIEAVKSTELDNLF